MLLPKSLLSIQNSADLYEAVKGTVLAATEDGTFTYTDLLLSGEALSTIAFMVMDGTVFEQTIPRAGAYPAIQSGPLRLVCIDTAEKVAADNAGLPAEKHRQLWTMKHSAWFQPRIPGTSERGKPIKKTIDYGMDAMIDDSLDQGRIARAMLVKYGWPTKNIQSTSGVVGHIVEWRWLEKAALAAGTAPEDQEIRDLYEQLKARGETKQQTKRPSAPQGAGASP